MGIPEIQEGGITYVWHRNAYRLSGEKVPASGGIYGRPRAAEDYPETERKGYLSRVHLVAEGIAGVYLPKARAA